MNIFLLLLHYTDMYSVDCSTVASARILQNNGHESIRYFRIPFRYLHGSTIVNADNMIQNIAKVLKYRRAFSLSEECIAELYTLLSHRIYHNRSLIDYEQYRFVEKYCGLVVVAKEVSCRHV
jgi:hypothetical protein